MALTANRVTDQFGGDYGGPMVNRFFFPVAASVTIYSGAAVALDSSGNANPGGNGSGSYVAVTAVGRADQYVPNTGSAGAVGVNVRQGAFKWDVSGSILQSAWGTSCYQVDDHTVQATNGSGAQPCNAGMFCGYDLTDPEPGGSVMAIVYTVGAGKFGVIT